MSENSTDDWSPADNPYAIAVSQSQWHRAAVLLTLRRMYGQDEHAGPFSSRQIDARTLIGELRQLLAAVALERFALVDLGMDQAVIDALDQAEQSFLSALPDIKHMRDGLTHFDEWSRGMGKFGPQAKARKSASPREVAREFWSFGYDPAAGTVTMGPYVIDVSEVAPAANMLCHAIYTAARAVDRRRVVELRGRVLQALDGASIEHDPPQGPVLVPDGPDPRVWLSFNLNAIREANREDLAQRVEAVLKGEGLRLSSQQYPQATDDMVERLVMGEPLIVERA